MRHLKRTGLAVVMVVLVGTLVAVAGSAPPRFSASSLTPDSTYSAAKSSSGSLAQTDPSLLGRTDSTAVNVLLKYDYDATASYAGGVAGLAATSPAITGKPLKDNRPAVRAYESHTAQVSDAISSAVEQAVPGVTIRRSYETAYGGVSATVPANKVADLLKVAGVAAVQKDSLEQPQDDNTQFIGAQDVWKSDGSNGCLADANTVPCGKNVIVADLDTGIWPEQPMVSPAGISAPPGGLRGCSDFATGGPGGDVAHLGPAFTCNNKLIGAYAFTDTYMAVLGSDGDEFCNNATGVCSPRDSDGHGTHTLTTAAGDCVSNAVLYGVDHGPVCGIAPGAHVIMYRVCLEQGCFQSDSVAAIQQAIADGVDVINFSISGGANPYSDAVELAFLDAFNAGISVNASAGNSGPGAGTADHGGPWVTTVGASTGPRFFQSTLHLTADGGATFDMPGITLVNGISTPTPVVLGQSIPGEDAGCLTQLAPGSAATGKIVLCQRGPNRVLRGFNVYSGGAAGMILYNPIDQTSMSDNHWLPAIHVNGPPTALLAFVNSHTNVKAMWAQGVPTPTTPDVMTEFSSRGPSSYFVKPDVTAPGLQVLAGNTPDPDSHAPVLGPPGNLYQAIAGTSMSSPHSAGVSALVKAVHPDWTPAEIKSALMTSSAQDVVNWDGSAATPFDDGAGSIRANLAADPTLVFDETFADYVASATDPLHRADLNIASVDATTMTGLFTTKRTAINVSGKDQDLEVSTTSSPGTEIIVTDKAPKGPGPHGEPAQLPKSSKHIHLKKNGTTDIFITISAPESANGQYFGRVTLDPKQKDANPVTIPVAFNKRQGIVTLTHDCSPDTFPAKTGVAHCAASIANFSSLPANAGLTVTNLDKGKGLDFTNISAPATAIKKDDGVVWNGTLTAALAPLVTSITPTTGPGPGYLPLSALGVGPLTGQGDETITNLTVPTFYYGAEPYTSIGVVSDGYVVIGGGTQGDVAFVPQTFPNPARPNNVVAPVWTDLNPAFGGSIRAAVLSSGPAGPTQTRWLVVDYENVRNYTAPTTHTFEIWLRLSGNGAGVGPASEQTTISYGPGTILPGSGNGNAGLGEPGNGVNSGAENRDGSSGVNISPTPPNSAEYAVNTSPPTAGGTVTITYDASSKKPGTYKTVAGMTSDLTPGTTQVVKTLTVTP